tara:strand:+ start:640 stop:1914 length:1275 start_codon:yes stop_codon:yes gene_type:complete
MSLDVLLGLQWGDEGKGKIVDAITGSYDIIARFQGGPNAGHTIEFEGNKHVLHTIPSGIFNTNAINLIGNGVVIDPVIFENEINGLQKFNLDINSKLLISNRAHIILPTHKMIDASSEASKGKKKIGSTLKGIGPTYMDKTGRNGIRIGDLKSDNWTDKYNALRDKHLTILSNFKIKIDLDLDKLEDDFMGSIEILKKFNFINSEDFLNTSLISGKRVLAEGAQGSLLDIDFGTYPFVTSSNTTVSGACSGLGIAPNKIKNVIGIFKAYTTRVGSGPFPTELNNEIGSNIRKIGNEYGATTGRDRRCGWLDLVALKYSIIINGVTELNMMKADVLSGFDTIEICTEYNIGGIKTDTFPFDLNLGNIKPIYKSFKGWTEDISKISKDEELPVELHNYVSFIEEFVGVPIKLISVGPDRSETIYRK